MITDLLFYQLPVLALVWLCLMLYMLWLNEPPAPSGLIPTSLTAGAK